MLQTSPDGLRYPVDTDFPDVPRDFKNLAEDVQAALQVRDYLPWTRHLATNFSVPNGTVMRAVPAGTSVGPLASQWSGSTFTFPEGGTGGIWLISVNAQVGPVAAVDAVMEVRIGGTATRLTSGRLSGAVSSGMSQTSIEATVATGSTVTFSVWHGHGGAVPWSTHMVHILRLSNTQPLP
jgi:hypothetical protein